MFQRAILHLDLDCFFVSVECLHNPALKGKPVLIGGHSRRGVVASCSYEARVFGVHAAMPMMKALKLCPNAIVVKGRMDSYSEHSKMVKAVVKAEAPLFEQASIDEFNLDLTGMDKYFGAWKWSNELRQKIIKETGLPISMGLSSNKMVSKVAAGLAKPNGSRLVEAGAEKLFLAPLDIDKLPGIGRQTGKKLRYMGIHKIGALSELSLQFLQKKFGEKYGLWLHKKSNGVDDSPIVPFHLQKSMSKERTFHEDTLDADLLRNRLTRMVMDLTFELRRKKKMTGCIHIKVRYFDFDTYTQQRSIPFTSSDKILIRQAHELFDQLFCRRMVRLLGVGFSHLIDGHHQMDLFDETLEDIRLMEALDKVRGQYGMSAVLRASVLRR
ncbi:MAG TPA: DNA polymerase IV [Saprospiraceae bacterium]|nr:DNA polymerase IV [Saprospiraceae bacterium]